MDVDYYDFEANTDLNDYFLGIFKQFDKKGESAIELGDLGTALRMCGMAPTEADIAGWCKQYDDGTYKISSDIFLEIVKKSVTDYKGLEALKDAFRSFDPNLRGYLPPHEIRYILTNFGEKLTDEEINDFLAEAAIADVDTEGNVNYETFLVKFMPDFMQ